MKDKIALLLNRFGYKYFFSIPPQSKIIYYELVLYLLLIVGSFLLGKIFLERRSNSYRKFAKIIFLTNASFALTGLVFIFARYEFLPLFSFRIWQFLNIILIIGINCYFYYVKNKQVKDMMMEEQEKKRKQKWLPKGKKKK